MFPQWYYLSFLALVLYGLWGFWGTLTAAAVDSQSGMFYTSIGTLLAGIICLFLLKFKLQVNWSGVSYGTLTGLATGIGTIFFIAALRKGPAIPVVMVTALYPLITTILCLIFLHQTISVRQIFGIVCSITALLLLAK